MRYLGTRRGMFNKTHLVVGRGEYFETNCGMRFSLGSTNSKDWTLVRVSGGITTPGKRDRPADWSLYPTVNCKLCRKYPVKPFHDFQRKETTP